MLIVSLSFSVVLLALALWAVRRSPRPGTALLWYVPLGIFGPLVLCAFLPAVALHSILMPLVYGVWRWTGWSRGAFTALAVATMALAYLLPGLLPKRGDPYLARLREQYPYESLEARLPPVRPATRPVALPAVAAARLVEMEHSVQREANTHREWMLRELHENSVRTFVESPGFGVGRRIGPNTYTLTRGLRNDPVPRQPALDDSPGWYADFVGEPPALHAGEEDRFLQMHGNSVLDFVNPGGFGLVKDRRRVAGFQPHQFSRVPEPGERWLVETVELVSLLMHDEPRVYVSANLPKMDQLKGVPTRTLDATEAAGLKALQGGEDLFVRSTESGLRMLGSLRAVKQCVTCHDGQRGDLLGAFAYTLRPTR